MVGEVINVMSYAVALVARGVLPVVALVVEQVAGFPDAACLEKPKASHCLGTVVGLDPKMNEDRMQEKLGYCL